VPVAQFQRIAAPFPSQPKDGPGAVEPPGGREGFIAGLKGIHPKELECSRAKSIPTFCRESRPFSWLCSLRRSALQRHCAQRSPAGAAFFGRFRNLSTATRAPMAHVGPAAECFRDTDPHEI